MWDLFDEGIDWVSQGHGYWIFGRWAIFVICFFASVCLACLACYTLYKLAYRNLLYLGIIPNPRPIPWLDNPVSAETAAPVILTPVGRPSALSEAERVGASLNRPDEEFEDEIDDDELHSDLNDGADLAVRPIPIDDPEDEPQSASSLAHSSANPIVLPAWKPRRRTPITR